MPIRPLDLAAIAVSLGLALILTPAIGTLARRYGKVARPRPDRWHKKPTALLGGVAIFTSVIAGHLLLPASPENLVVLAGGSWFFLVGLVDDLVHLSPYRKLLGQLIGAVAVVLYGLSLTLTGIAVLDKVLTVCWLLGISNGLNLLDNMDGLAAGIASVAGLSFAIHFLLLGQTTEAIQLAVFVAALIGFLIYNSPPASIFMGDSGSLFLGFFLASRPLLGTPAPETTWPAFLILAVPIFDTGLVIILRILAGRSIFQGGRDHSSHRLVALGLPERGAVGLLCGLGLLAGSLALASAVLPLTLHLCLEGVFVLGLIVLGVILGRVIDN